MSTKSRIEKLEAAQPAAKMLPFIKLEVWPGQTREEVISQWRAAHPDTGPVNFITRTFLEVPRSDYSQQTQEN